MRISGNILDRILNSYLPPCILYYFLSFIIPAKRLNYPTNIERLYFFTAILLFITIVETLKYLFRRIKTLKIDDEIILADKHITCQEILSIETLYYGNSFGVIKFTIQKDGLSQIISVMDKPKFFGFIGPKGSKTLHYLYSRFPELKEKEIQVKRRRLL